MICSADQYYCSVFQTPQEFNIQPGWRLGPVGMPRVHNMRFHPATWTHKSCMHIARHRRSDVGAQGEIGGKADSAKSGPPWSCDEKIADFLCFRMRMPIFKKKHWGRLQAKTG